MADDELCDSLGPNGAPRKASTTAPNAPPSFAFDHGSNISTPSGPPTNYEDEDDEDELGGAIRSRAPSVLSSQLNDRWNRYETETDGQRNESSLENKAVVGSASTTSSTSTTRTELSPRQPYAFRNSDAYDTDQLIRKYGGLTGVVPGAVAHNSRLVTASPSQGADVRDQAQKMLELVDEHLKTPLDIHRTESGGFRSAAPTAPETEAFSFRRGSSSSTTSTGKRVPAALSGLNLSQSKPANWKQSGRYSFSDPNFRDDDRYSDEDDSAVVAVPFEDEPVVDVEGMERRAGGTRPYSGDFEGGSKAWSSRYSDTSSYVSQQKHVLDKWDKEFGQQQLHGQQDRKSARNMFMSTASSIRSSASNVLASAAGGGQQKQKVFGSGGFSFRANHVFGHHNNNPEVNLRAAWREVDEDSPAGLPPVHKTWQEVMLNKRKRRRILGALVLLILAGTVCAATLSALKKRSEKTASMFTGSSGKGSETAGEQGVTFYVTSNSPYDKQAEERLTKDLVNIPIDSEFIVHLGNIQDSAISLCSRNKYSEVASILVKSPVPVFILPGAEDWTKCPNPDASLQSWYEAFFDFDKQFKRLFEVKRDDQNPEAFAVLHKGVLFVGMHIVSGPIMEDDEAWQTRQKAMLKWYYGMANVHKDKFRSIVLFGNARPSAQQSIFFDTLFSNLKNHDTPIVYIHANENGETVMQSHPFKDHTAVEVIGVQNGSAHPPLKVTVGFGERPFMVG